MSAPQATRLFDAVGDLALAICPHNMDNNQRAKVRAALHVLVDEIICIGEAEKRQIMERKA